MWGPSVVHGRAIFTLRSVETQLSGLRLVLSCSLNSSFILSVCSCVHTSRPYPSTVDIDSRTVATVNTFDIDSRTVVLHTFYEGFWVKNGNFIFLHISPVLEHSWYSQQDGGHGFMKDFKWKLEISFFYVSRPYQLEHSWYRQQDGGLIHILWRILGEKLKFHFFTRLARTRAQLI